MSGAALRTIGTIRTSHTAAEHTPVQAALNQDEEGLIELDARYTDAIEGLDECTHAWLITWLAPVDTQSPEPALRQVPFLLRRRPRELGIFATRGPRRPNPIGLSLVRIVAVGRSTIRFAGVDVLDGTPLLDIKPYVRRFDEPSTPVRSGWFDTLTFDDRITPDSLGPIDAA